MAQNLAAISKRTQIPPPDVFMSEEILDSTNPGHSLTKSTPSLPLVKFSGATATTSKGTTPKQKTGKHTYSANVKDLSEAEREVSLPGSSTILLFRSEDNYDIQDRPRPNIHHSDLFNNRR
jgi:hypothetical protein